MILNPPKIRDPWPIADPWPHFLTAIAIGIIFLTTMPLIGAQLFWLIAGLFGGLICMLIVGDLFNARRPQVTEELVHGRVRLHRFEQSTLPSVPHGSWFREAVNMTAFRQLWIIVVPYLIAGFMGLAALRIALPLMVGILTAPFVIPLIRKKTYQLEAGELCIRTRTVWRSGTEQRFDLHRSRISCDLVADKLTIQEDDLATEIPITSINRPASFASSLLAAARRNS